MDMFKSLKFGLQARSLQKLATQPKRVKALQRQRLDKLIRFAVDNSPFYRKRFSSIDLNNFSIRDFPPVTKAELMDHFEEVVTQPDIHKDELAAFVDDSDNLGKYYKGKYAPSHTSGSSGQPLLLVQSKSNVELLFALQASRGNRKQLNLCRALQRLVQPARLAVVTLKRGFYPSAAAFEYMPAHAQRYIQVLRLSSSEDDIIQRLAAFHPTHLTAYASVLHQLASEIELGGLQLKPYLEQVVNNSERLTSSARKRYEQTFGAPVLDNYASGECPFLSNGCSAGPGMHINADWCILEVVDRDYNPVPEGERGDKVLITNLANEVQPIIRYEVGDVVRMATQPCGCGSKLPLVAEISGRDSEVLYVRKLTGETKRITPIIFQHALKHVLTCREYQVVQNDFGRVQLRLEPLPGAAIDVEHANRMVERELRKYDLEDLLEVELEVVDDLVPEDQASKYKRVINNVKEETAEVVA